MIGIEAVATYLPEGFIDNRDRLEKFGIKEEFLTDKSGMVKVARKNKGDETSDLACYAVRSLVEQTSVDLNELDCLILCTQNPDGAGLPHTSAIVHGKLDLPDTCAVFDISLGCSGFVYGLSIIKSFMEGNGFKKGLLVTADPYSKILNEDDKNTSLLFGDGATATLIGENPKWTIGKFSFGSKGSEHKAIMTNPDSGYFEMNGRGVFNFTSKVIPGNIEKTISANGLAKDDIALFLLHQGSKFICNTLANRLGVPLENVPFLAKDYGNVVSSSVPMLMNEYIDSDGPILISGFGVGLSWSSCVLTRNK